MNASRRDLFVSSFAVLSTSTHVHPAEAQSGKRVALVIGNGAYRGVPPLANPTRDAHAGARAFTRLGFRTELLIDAERLQMLEAIRRLADAATGAEAAVFYYAGHAVEFGGRNLLLPISVIVTSGSGDLERTSLPFDEVTSALQGRAQTTLLFLDACRNSPFAERAAGGRNAFSSANGRGNTRSVGSGLASVSSASGTLIAFATAPGHVALDGEGQNSPFTAALLLHIETPALEVRQMLGRVRLSVRQETSGRQVPWDNSSLEGIFFFRPPAADPAFRRTAEAAAARSIPLPPDLRTRAFRPTAGINGRFVGSWGGENRWGGKGRQILLVILSIDDSAATADAILSFGPSTNTSATQGPPRWMRAIAQLRSGVLEFGDARTGWRYSFQFAAEDELAGIAFSPDGTRLQIRIRRIE